MTLHQLIQGKTYEIAMKLGGMSHLFQNFHSEGTRDRDEEDLRGIGVIFENLSDYTKRLSYLIELAEGQDQNMAIAPPKYEHDDIGFAIRLLEAKRNMKKEEVGAK